MSDETRVVPFAKPRKVARLDRPPPEDRARIFDSLLETSAAAEADPGVVGYCVVFLCDDGQRRVEWACQRQANYQMARVVRKTASELLEKANKEWPE